MDLYELIFKKHVSLAQLGAGNFLVWLTGPVHTQTMLEHQQ